MINKHIKNASILLPLLLQTSMVSASIDSNAAPWIGFGLGSGFLSETNPDYHSGNTSRFMAKLDAGYDINSYLGAYGSYDYFQSTWKKNDLHLMGLGMYARYNVVNDISVFGKLGGSIVTGKNNDSKMLPSIGGGVEYKLNNVISTRLGFDYINNININNDPFIPNEDADLWQVYWGLTYKFNQPLNTYQKINELEHLDIEKVELDSVGTTNSGTDVVGVDCTDQHDTSDSLKNEDAVITNGKTEKSELVTMYFEHASSELVVNDEINEVLNEMLRNMQSRVVLIGHSDSSGNASYNSILSEKRAKSVKNYLTENGIDFKRIIISSQGDSYPIGDNVDFYGSAKNRRVEMYLINN